LAPGTEDGFVPEFGHSNIVRLDSWAFGYGPSPALDRRIWRSTYERGARRPTPLSVAAPTARDRRQAGTRSGPSPSFKLAHSPPAPAATCAEACGVLARLHEGTLEYTRQRKQFGQPISAFQVLQHRMVDMFIQVEQSISMTYMATIKLGDDRARSKACAAAKVQIGKACKFVGQNAIQLHGGMGMTDEMAIGHYYKRATMIESAFGSTDHFLARYEFLSLGQAA
jgi:hypothetical protein